jgi:hypothetical protein
MSRDSSVGTAMGHGMDARGSIPGRGKNVFSPPHCPDWLLDPLSLLSNRTGALSPEVKRYGREANHSPPSKAEVKNSEAPPPLPLTSSWRGA